MLTAGRPTARTGRRGTVFLLHAHQASGPAAHFVGCAVDVDAHLTQLRAGGVRLAAVAAGVDLELACTWSGGRGNAETLGNRTASCRSCRICRAATGQAAQSPRPRPL
jgi:hypothetical protein